MAVNNPVDALLDPENNENVILYKADGTEVEFEQVAIIPVNEQLFAILHMVEPTDGVGENEALVFSLTELEDGQVEIAVVNDNEVIENVFEGYYKLLEANGQQIN